MRFLRPCLPFLLLAFVVTAQAREITGKLWNDNDWRVIDRLVFESISGAYSAAQMKHMRLDQNAFVSAAAFNTQHQKPAEYATAKQRNTYYDWLAYRLSIAGPDRGETSGIRFFHATTIVTSKYLGISGLDHPLLPFAVHFDFVQQETLDKLRTINAALFDANMALAHRVLFDWKEPRDPNQSNPASLIGALEFDRRMVHFEQSRVQQHLDGWNLPQRERQTLNKAIRASLAYRNSILRSKEYLLAAGVDSFDFFALRDRVALGCAYVYRLHGLKLDAYSNYMNTEYPLAVKR